MNSVADNGLVEIRVPDIGNYKDVEVIEVAVNAGDSIGVEGTLITLETEKATMDVPSTTAGTIRELKVQRGARVSQGDVIAVVEATASAVAPASPAPPLKAAGVVHSAGEVTASQPSPQPAPAAAGEGAKTQARAGIDEPGFARAHASPSVRKLARELGVDLTKVQGSGDKGRITDVDVKAYVKRMLTSGVLRPRAVRRCPACPLSISRRSDRSNADP